MCNTNHFSCFRVDWQLNDLSDCLQFVWLQCNSKYGATEANPACCSTSRDWNDLSSVTCRLLGNHLAISTAATHSFGMPCLPAVLVFLGKRQHKKVYNVYSKSSTLKSKLVFSGCLQTAASSRLCRRGGLLTFRHSPRLPTCIFNYQPLWCWEASEKQYCECKRCQPFNNSLSSSKVDGGLGVKTKLFTYGLEPHTSRPARNMLVSNSWPHPTF